MTESDEWLRPMDTSNRCLRYDPDDEVYPTHPSQPDPGYLFPGPPTLVWVTPIACILTDLGVRMTSSGGGETNF